VAREREFRTRVEANPGIVPGALATHHSADVRLTLLSGIALAGHALGVLAGLIILAWPLLPVLELVPVARAEPGASAWAT